MVTRRHYAAALLLAACLAGLGAAGEGSGAGDHAGRGHRKKVRGARAPPAPQCAAGDATCLALLELECDPYHAAVEDKCAFVGLNPHCTEDVHRFDYLSAFYCAPGVARRVAVSLALLAWLVLLFFVMSTVAEAFLCPAIQFLAAWLRMPADIAGLTLFAFASGAPDLFTQISAVAKGDHVDLDLAVSATFGGGLFIIAVVFSAVVLVAPADQTEVPDRRAFVRDASAYLVASLLTLVLLAGGEFSSAEAVALLVGYVVYLVICVKTSSHRSSGPAPGPGPGGADAEAARLLFTQAYYPTSTEEEGGGGLGGNVDASEPGAVELAAVVVRGVPATPLSVAGRVQRKLSPGPRSLPLAPASPGIAAKQQQWQNGGGGGGDAGVTATVEVETAAAPILPRSPGPAARAGSGGSGGGGQSVRDVRASLAELIHLPPQPGWRKVAALLTAPVVLAIHATMPATGSGTFSMRYGAVLSLGAPAFLMLGTGLGPARIGLAAFFLGWLLSAALLHAALYAVQPGGLLGRPGRGWRERRPRRNVLFAGLAFVVSAVWMSVVADEVVALFEASGRICNVSEDVLGATVLAWGETVPDLVATITLARAGQGTMAIAACFGGPVFNLLVSMGAPTLYATVQHGTLQYRLSSGVVLLVGFTVALLAFLLIAVPFGFDWRLQRRVALMLLLLYVSCQLLFVWVEEEDSLVRAAGGAAAPALQQNG